MGELLVDQSCVVGRSPWPCSGRAPGSWRWRRCRAVATGRVESGHRVMVSWATHSTSHRSTHTNAHRRARGVISAKDAVEAEEALVVRRPPEGTFTTRQHPVS